MTARIFSNISAIAGIAGLALTWSGIAQAQEFGSPELIAAAKAEGKLVFYTANFAEVEQQVIKAFNKRFPEIKVEMVRAPGGQLITRVRTEAAAGKVIDHVGDQFAGREGDHPVVVPAQAESAVGQLGGESGVCRVEGCSGDERRQEQVGVGVVGAHGGEDVVGDAPGGLDAGRGRGG